MVEWDIVWESRDEILSGLATTLWILVLSVTFAFLFACIVVYRLGQGGVIAVGLRWLVSGMRTLPFLILVYVLYYGLPQLGLRMSAVTAGFIAMIAYHGAYFAEILRGSEMVLPRGYVEAAKAHGFRPVPTYLRIVLPQLIIRTRPILGNQLIIALKDTAFLSIITVRELTAAANAMQAQYFVPTQAFIVVIGLYWIITICIEVAINKAGVFGSRRGFENV